MKDQDHIEPGTLELFAMGALSSEENAQIAERINNDPKLAAEVDKVERAMLVLASSNAQAPPPHVKTRIMEAIDELEQEKAAEHAPPILHPASVASDYQRWIDDPEMCAPVNAENVFFIPFAENEDGMSAIAWINGGSPIETHTNCIEKFLILEGECEIHMQGNVHQLKPGSTFSIPLHVPHELRVTSAVPCKAIVQRIAA